MNDKIHRHHKFASLLKRRLEIGLFLALLFLAQSPMALAQVSRTLSPYSCFGLGLLNDQSQGFNKSMGGVGLGVRVGNRINTTNPASYSAIDSLSLLFDVGMSASFGQMRQGTTKVNVKSATLDYVHVGMHVAKRLGLAVGFMPFTSIGHSFSRDGVETFYNSQTMQSIKGNSIYTGEGGLNQAYIGLGWKAFRNISIGANISFVWGEYSNILVQQFSEGGVSSSSFNTIAKYYTASLKTYKLDFGAQYPVQLTRQDWLNLGATFGLGHKIAQDAELTIGDSTSVAKSPFDLPYSFGIGASWQHKNTLMVAADVHQELWSSCHMPIETAEGYVPMKGYYNNRTKIALGTQWTPDPYGKYLERIQYRAGFSYTTPYLKVNGANGPKEFSLNIGAGLPITNKINNRSVVNVGLQWLRRSPSAAGMIKEDYLLINLGMTFNERWFLKYKIE